MVVLTETIKAYGVVHRIQKEDIEDIFIQDNNYYFCEVEMNISSQKLDDYEAKERFAFEFFYNIFWCCFKC